jgi:hypothetical protein
MAVLEFGSKCFTADNPIGIMYEPNKAVVIAEGYSVMLIDQLKT